MRVGHKSRSESDILFVWNISNTMIVFLCIIFSFFEFNIIDLRNSAFLLTNSIDAFLIFCQ